MSQRSAIRSRWSRIIHRISDLVSRENREIRAKEVRMKRKEVREQRYERRRTNDGIYEHFASKLAKTVRKRHETRPLVDPSVDAVGMCYAKRTFQKVFYYLTHPSTLKYTKLFKYLICHNTCQRHLDSPKVDVHYPAKPVAQFNRSITNRIQKMHSRSIFRKPLTDFNFAAN